MMGLPINEIMNENSQKIAKKNSKTPQKQQLISSKAQSAIVIKTKTIKSKQNDVIKQVEQLAYEKQNQLNDQEPVNQKRIDNNNLELFAEDGVLASNYPDIISQIKGKQKKNIQKYTLTFEEMVELNTRKRQEQFQKSEVTNNLEEQMMKYAKEFNEKIKNRELLKQNIKFYISDNKNKLDEFWQWDENERNVRNDKVQCFKRYVKMIREGQIKLG